MPTTTRRPATDIADFLAGFVAGEGCFHARPTEGRFSFAVALAAVDQSSIDLLDAFFRCGRTTWCLRRQAHFDDEVTFVVQRVRDLVEVVVPFMDEHLPSSYKREQYLVWRAELLRYWATRARKPCRAPGCQRRAKREGLCGAHHHLAFGR